MTGKQFLTKLKQYLNGLPQDEIDGALEYYKEYIDDAGGYDIDVTELLGTPKEAAMQIKSACESDNPDTEEKANTVSVRGLTDVHSIVVSAVSGDIEFLPAEDFGCEILTTLESPEWKLDSGVFTVSESKSDNGSVKLSSLFFKPKRNMIKPFVKIYYRQDSGYESITAANVSGKLILPGAKGVIDSLNAATVSGSVKLSDITSNDFNAASVSGGVNLNNMNVQTGNVQTTSGGIFATDYSGKLNANSVSGGIMLTGAYTGGKLNTVSGSVKVETTLPESNFTYKLHSFSGNITINDTPQPRGADIMQNRSSLNHIIISTVNGKIGIRFGG